jgi:hypothetical protein
VTAAILAALLSVTPAKSKAASPRPSISNVEGDGDAVVSRSTDGRRPMIVKREKPLAMQIEDGLRDAGKRIEQEARKARDAIGKLVQRWR